jgi:very-short-patch-repair endonuclease
VSTPLLSRDRARRLRRDQTDAERRLWMRLRRHQLGVQFRRQHPIGPYIVDFCCVERMMVVELDGGQHQDQRTRDEARTMKRVHSGSPGMAFACCVFRIAKL